MRATKLKNKIQEERRAYSRSTKCIPAALLDKAGATEINKDTFASVAKDDIFILDVAMDDSVSMKKVEGIRDLAEIGANG
jgi:hypothetical protein